jgi:hypothetical protein
MVSVSVSFHATPPFPFSSEGVDLLRDNKAHVCMSMCTLVLLLTLQAPNVRQLR